MNNIYYQDSSGALINADALNGLKELKDESVDFCITSPPYWAQRKYQPGNELELGQEPNFKDFVSNLADIFDEVRRVLKPSGSLWVVINDTWFSSRKGTGGKGSIQDHSIGSSFTPRNYEKLVEPKSLCNIPHRLAIELIDNRKWIHRFTVCWQKNNIMPQPHADKPTRDFEYILVFTKNRDSYHKQLLEPYKEPINRWGGEENKAGGSSNWDKGTGQNTYRKRNLRPNPDGKNIRSVWNMDGQFGEEENEIWSVNNDAIRGLKHYAKFPRELVRRGIEFGCPENGVVLDPFMGSGTTAIVAKKMGRKWIGTEINKEYCDTIVKRIKES